MMLEATVVIEAIETTSTFCMSLEPMFRAVLRVKTRAATLNSNLQCFVAAGRATASNNSFKRTLGDIGAHVYPF